MRYIVDIDETICTKEKDQHYSQSIPYHDRIQKINDLYDQGHEIWYWTARGMATGVDHYELTLSQLYTWGCRYHQLKMGKPSYDVWVDDKASWIFDQ